MTMPYSPHVRELIQHLQALPIQAPPPPWQPIASFAVGGLLAVGYAEDTDLLLVISTQGRGIFDCQLGTKIARDYTDADKFYDEITLLAQGFGPLDGQVLRIAGLFGGGLPNSTRDGWHLQAIPLPWPQHSIVLELPFRSMYQDKTSATRVGEDGACELRAYGFSSTGRSFVIATSCDLAIFTRANEAGEQKKQFRS
jgi:hypothetical protein